MWIILKTNLYEIQIGQKYNRFNVKRLIFAVK